MTSSASACVARTQAPWRHQKHTYEKHIHPHTRSHQQGRNGTTPATCAHAGRTRSWMSSSSRSLQSCGRGRRCNERHSAPGGRLWRPTMSARLTLVLRGLMSACDAGGLPAGSRNAILSSESCRPAPWVPGIGSYGRRATRVSFCCELRRAQSPFPPRGETGEGASRQHVHWGNPTRATGERHSVRNQDSRSQPTARVKSRSTCVTWARHRGTHTLDLAPCSALTTVELALAACGVAVELVPRLQSGVCIDSTPDADHGRALALPRIGCTGEDAGAYARVEGPAWAPISLPGASKVGACPCSARGSCPTCWQDCLAASRPPWSRACAPTPAHSSHAPPVSEHTHRTLAVVRPAMVPVDVGVVQGGVTHVTCMQVSAGTFGRTGPHASDLNYLRNCVCHT